MSDHDRAERSSRPPLPRRAPSSFALLPASLIRGRIRIRRVVRAQRMASLHGRASSFAANYVSALLRLEGSQPLSLSGFEPLSL